MMSRPIRHVASRLVGAIAVGTLAACSLPGGAGTSSPAPSHASLSEAEETPLVSGRYITDGAFEPRVVLTIPEGWSKNDYGVGRVSLVKQADDDLNVAFVTVYLVRDVYADPCDGGTPVAPAAGDAESLVTALRAQPGFEIGALSEWTLDGRPAWTWEVTPMIDVSTCASDPWLYQFRYPGATEDAPIDGGTIAAAVQRFTVVDLDGTPILIEVGTFEWTTDADVLEANDMADAVTFD